jgi:hypothetical protein
VILIDEQAKCLSCGASPSLAAASPREEEHHRAERGHGAGSEAESDVLAKLRILLPHWIEHNAEHAESFLVWAERARAAGDDHLAIHIEEAARKTEAANRDLEGGLKHIGTVAGEHVHVHHEHSH